jgi:hypothetical protein
MILFVDAEQALDHRLVAPLAGDAQDVLAYLGLGLEG